MEDSECWRAVGRVEVGHFITDVSRFFGVHHSMSFHDYGNNSKTAKQLSEDL